MKMKAIAAAGAVVDHPFRRRGPPRGLICLFLSPRPLNFFYPGPLEIDFSKGVRETPSLCWVGVEKKKEPGVGPRFPGPGNRA